MGAALVLAACLVWVRGALTLVRANPGAYVPYEGNRRRGGYEGMHLLGFVLGLVGAFQLNDELGWWAYVIAVVVFAGPAMVIIGVHNRRARPRARR